MGKKIYGRLREPKGKLNKVRVVYGKNTILEVSCGGNTVLVDATGKVVEGENIMKLKKGELRVFYNVRFKGLDSKMDADIEKVLKKYGYKRWASGCEMKTGLRDLCFEKKK